MEKSVVIKGCAGLGNRLYTLSNALEYAKKTNRKIYVDWSDGLYGAKGNNVFNKYFSLVDIPIVENIETLQYESIYPTIWKSYDIHTSLYDIYQYGHPKIYIKDRFLPSKGVLLNSRGYFYYTGKPYSKVEITGVTQFISSLFSNKHLTLGGYLPYNKEEDVIIFADYVPKFYPQNLIKHLRLSETLSEKIDNFRIKNNLDNAIGCHIRNTDRKNLDSIDSISAKISVLAPNTVPIFLSTDDSIIELELKKRFPNVITYPKILPVVDSSIGGIHHYAQSQGKPDLAETIFEQSIIDMWLLSRCNYLLYMGNSSFSKIAVTLHSTKCIDWLLK